MASAPLKETDSKQPLLLGVDGGGTSCRARIADLDGNILGEGFAGSANPRTGLDSACNAIMQATREAMDKAGLRENDFGRMNAGLGLAGVNQKKERDLVLGWGFPFAGIFLETDAYAACMGAFNGQDGAILILGTGSCGASLIDGEMKTLGGWGFPISDHGSGASLGLAAVRYSLLAHEGMKEETPLSKAIMATFDNSPENAVAWQDSALPRDYGSYGPVVVEYLSKGDKLAEQLIRKSAEDAAMMIRVLHQRGANQCALVGGLSEFVMPWLPEDVVSIATLPQGDAMHGALLMAAKLI
ncbi:BadF/BadG/BcrA/BcrD ATPase family protein [Endozoicomonas elysicola]|uniref:N-acetylglucosamine kinase n=1 Tax=Endozoicomonas elysicola TaxID=305900 RepID=A0A081KFV7_9GAMM|nr:BadF/BadG/BcrA/BcrD ATPase family protein [Endozoicomonas elysicola]KEI73033.1 N-acetylglucosamine kinase [Endozoicomonas elysicola]